MGSVDFTTLESYKKLKSTFDKIDLDDYEVYNVDSIKNPLQDLLDFVEKDSDLFRPLPQRRSKTLDKLRKQSQGVIDAVEQQDKTQNYHDTNDFALETSHSPPQKKSRIVKSEPDMAHEKTRSLPTRMTTSRKSPKRLMP